MPTTATELNELYVDPTTCAALVGLNYVGVETVGITRLKHGKGFTYKNNNGEVIADTALKRQITELVIPPAWKDVWICPDNQGHILATGIDEKGRKQYMYHPKWRTMRDLIKFYRMIVFGKALPRIRETIEADLRKRTLGSEKVIGTMLWLLDNTYIRIGNEQYYEQNDSVGLTTLSDKNVIVAGPVITLSFKGKSGKNHQISFEDKRIAHIISQLKDAHSERIFAYFDEHESEQIIDSAHINKYLHDITSVHISAKDFRTWGGTLMAFNHLIETERSPDPTPKAEKVIVDAIDAAAAVLGNTRSIARSSYVHPHILSTYGTKNFAKYYQQIAKKPTIKGLDKRETELLSFLEQLFEEEFTLLKQ